MMGYAGLRFDEDGIFFAPLPGVLTPASKAIHLRQLLIRGTYPFDYTLDSIGVHFVTSNLYSNILCVTDQLQYQWKINSIPLDLEFEQISLPLRVDLCS